MTACLLVAACTNKVEVWSKLPDGTKEQVRVTDATVTWWQDPNGRSPDPDPALKHSLQTDLDRALAANLACSIRWPL